MNRSADRSRLVIALLALGCAVVMGVAGYRSVALVLAARTQELNAAEQLIARGAGPLIRQDRIPGRLVEAVQSLLGGAKGQHVDFVTLRNAANTLLVSRGSLTDNSLDWIPFGAPRAWRSWLYRARSAEATRTVSRAGQRVGSAHFGVTWQSVAERAGLSLLVLASVGLAALIGLIGLLQHRSEISPGAASAGKTATSGERNRSTRRASPTSGGATSGLMHRLRRRLHETHKDDFALIGSASGGPAAPGVSEPLPAARPAKPIDAPAVANPGAIRILGPVERGAGTGTATRPGQANARPAVRAGEFKNSALVATPPVLQADEQMPSAPGDEALAPGFCAIWQGTHEKRVLAGAFAGLVRRTNDCAWVSIETLAQQALARRGLAAFTHAYIRRFAITYRNWRSLELDAVPILLPVVSPMLEFVGVGTPLDGHLRSGGWHDSGDGRADDLILQLHGDASSADAARTGSPFRHALRVDSPHAEAADECDVLCVEPPQIGGDVRAWFDRVDAFHGPVLLGPVDADEIDVQMLAHPRVFWFSGDADSIHAPRCFARLLARHETTLL